MESALEREKKVYINDPGHITKIATTPIYGKTIKNLDLRTQSHMLMKLGVRLDMLLIHIEHYTCTEPNLLS